MSYSKPLITFVGSSIAIIRGIYKVAGNLDSVSCNQPTTPTAAAYEADE